MHLKFEWPARCMTSILLNNAGMPECQKVATKLVCGTFLCSSLLPAAGKEDSPSSAHNISNLSYFWCVHLDLLEAILSSTRTASHVANEPDIGGTAMSCA